MGALGRFKPFILDATGACGRCPPHILDLDLDKSLASQDVVKPYVHDCGCSQTTCMVVEAVKPSVPVLDAAQPHAVRF